MQIKAEHFQFLLQGVILKKFIPGRFPEDGLQVFYIFGYVFHIPADQLFHLPGSHILVVPIVRYCL